MQNFINVAAQPKHDRCPLQATSIAKVTCLVPETCWKDVLHAPTKSWFQRKIPYDLHFKYCHWYRIIIISQTQISIILGINMDSLNSSVWTVQCSSLVSLKLVWKSCNKIDRLFSLANNLHFSIKCFAASITDCLHFALPSCSLLTGYLHFVYNISLLIVLKMKIVYLYFM